MTYEIIILKKNLRAFIWNNMYVQENQDNVNETFYQSKSVYIIIIVYIKHCHDRQLFLNSCEKISWNCVVS